MRKPASTDHPVHELVRERWSPRAFAEAPVSDADIASLLEAARWAPSSMNEQPWRFVVAERSDAEAHAAVLATLAEGNRKWAGQAPVLMIVAASKVFARNGRPNGHALYDAGAAMAWLTVEATARGLVLHQMGGFDRDKAAEALGISADFAPVVAVALGHPADLETLPPDVVERERAPRARKPQSEIAFRGRWGVPRG